MDSEMIVPTTNRGQAKDLARRIRAEMVAPRVEPRMEQLCHLAGVRITRHAARRFPKRTRNTRKRQVLERGRTANHPRNDVVDEERRFLADLGEPTVLAPIARSQSHSAL